MKIENFVRQYKLSKTLRFKLIPIGKTEEYFVARKLLEEDEERAKDYKVVKKLMDECHKKFINDCLAKFELTGLEEYWDIYSKTNKDDKDKKALDNLASNLRKQIGDVFKVNKYTDLKSKTIVNEYAWEFAKTDEEKKALENFAKFTTYFRGFEENRENMYTSEGKSTEVAYRVVDQNLGFFLDNLKNAKDIIDLLDEDKVLKLQSNFPYAFNDECKFYDVEFFNKCLTQEGIDKYNQFIGGFSLSAGEKIQGLNECINEYCQKNKVKLAKMKMLYKQILSDRETISFVLDAFDKDQDVLDAINAFYNDSDDERRSVKDSIQSLTDILSNIDTFDLNKVFVSAKDFAAVSKLAGNYRLIQTGIERQYDIDKGYDNLTAKKKETHFDKRSKYIQGIKELSLFDAQKYVSIVEDASLVQAIKAKVVELDDEVKSSYAKAEEVITSQYSDDKKLAKNDKTIEIIKAFLDAVLAYDQFVRMFDGQSIKEEKDEIFYGEVSNLHMNMDGLVSLYNKTRNYITAKPYSNDKIKLNFENPQFLGGWSKSKEKDYQSVLFVKDNNYYLGIMPKDCKKTFDEIPETDGQPCYKKMVYSLLPGPNKMLPKVFFSKKGLKNYQPPEEILSIYKNETFKSGKNFSLDDCHKLIDFYKESIAKNPEWDSLDFSFLKTESYETIADFYREVQNQGYKLEFVDVPESYIDSLVEEGKLYLFQIYNKDFSEHSKGTPNLHTLFFKMVFNEINLKNTIFALNGGAELFYRKPSLKLSETAIHTANEPISHKNPMTEGEHSIFVYDIIKDKRYTKPQFNFHVPITINFTSNDSAVGFNNLVREDLKESNDTYVIGIDRGERNLIYVCVLDKNGNIVEQKSLNIIGNTDYHAILDKRESDNKDSRKSWTTIQGIKDIKEGYVSQAVHEVCKLVEKYNAIIVMEDLNIGFKNSRIKVEKQVYQKFEKMLIDKLNYMCDKQKEFDEIGSVLNGYQLTNKFTSFQKMGKQNGIIFYIPAWLTSKIDPTTGFVDLMKPKYESVEKAKAFFGKFDDISYNASEGYFEFRFNYDNFDRGVTSWRKDWTVCTNGERIASFINPELNNNWDQRTALLTEEMKELFEKFGIDYSVNLKQQICDMDSKEFFSKLTHLLSLTLQMRNSIINGERDYLISPVKNSKGYFFNSDFARENEPKDADANGAYHIALKGLWAVKQIKEADDVSEAKLAISNKQWLEYAQSRF
ncbi:MAG: type V CRISPR-associated protein Cas12a/Cpf1 [Clostridia bacterium]|nr:type V CRISPR-associated protein Cas12a/Cpf1 [Clostridia bacterium]